MLSNIWWLIDAIAPLCHLKGQGKIFSFIFMVLLQLVKFLGVLALEVEQVVKASLADIGPADDFLPIGYAASM